MEVNGRVQNGVVVLEQGALLPEGVSVRVVCSSSPSIGAPAIGAAAIHVSPIRRQAKLPLVKTGRPGSVALTNDRIADILDEQDASS